PGGSALTSGLGGRPLQARRLHVSSHMGPYTHYPQLHSPGLAGRLAIVTAVLVTLAVAAVSPSGVRSLRKLAEAEGFARVELAVTAAREALGTSTENLLTAARVLAERPTLERLLSEPESDDALMPYLDRYCDGTQLHGCALLAGQAL